MAIVFISWYSVDTPRLLLTEQAGKICRDESIQGLRFYPNKFLLQ